MSDRCRGCGHTDGTHDPGCRVVEQERISKLQAECDHSKHGYTQTTGEPLGPPRCANCNAWL